MKKSKMRKKIATTILAVGLSVLIPTVILFGDFDGDRLSTLTELNVGTGVFSSDTDRDNLNDGLEVNVYGTHPLVLDTDNDGLSDGLEVNTYQTNPTIVDTDEDGLDDGKEALGSWHLYTAENYTRWTDYYGNTRHYSWTLKHKVWDDVAENFLDYYTWENHYSWNSPYDGENFLALDENGNHVLVLFTSDPRFSDTDNDGLDDYMEYIIGTDPRRRDTDNDGIDDASEVHVYKTIPFFYDTDGDMLGDGEEIITYLTNPSDWDTDNDRLSDRIEILGYDIDNDGTIDVDFPALGADPLVRDIFVEVDWQPNSKILGEREMGRLVEVFAENGFVLHIDNGDLGGGAETEEFVSTIYDSRPGEMNDLYDLRDKYFTLERRGTFYWCLTTTGTVQTQTGEVGGFNLGDIFVVGRMSAANPGPTFMHELGHGLGLNTDDFDGIDSYKYQFSMYRSVMNYNAPHDFYGYSDGPLFDDWGHIDFGG